MWFHDSGSSSGPTIVMLHGLGATSGFFRTVARDLGRDHRLVMPDLPGHGRSASGPAATTLRDAAQEVESIVSGLGIDRVVLLGWSLGATVAYHYLDLYGGDRVAALVSVEQTPRLIGEEGWEHAAFGGLDPSAARELVNTLSGGASAFLSDLVRRSFASGRSPDPDLVRELVSQSEATDPGSLRSLLADVISQDWRGRIGGFDLPVLLIHGARSQVYPTGVGRWLADAFPQGDLAEFERSGHLPFVEEPERFCREVRDFVSLHHG